MYPKLLRDVSTVFGFVKLNLRTNRTELPEQFIGEVMKNLD